MLEDRKYHENSTVEEICLIKDSVCFIEGEKKIIFFNELPQASPFTINLIFDEIEKMTEGLSHYGILIDLSNSKRPDAVTRRAIIHRFRRLETLTFCVICTGKNALINTALRFIMYGAIDSTYSVVKNKEEGVQKLKNALSQYSCSKKTK